MNQNIPDWKGLAAQLSSIWPLTYELDVRAQCLFCESADGWQDMKTWKRYFRHYNHCPWLIARQALDRPLLFEETLHSGADEK